MIPGKINCDNDINDNIIKIEHNKNKKPTIDSFGNKTIEYEPDDINNYDCLALHYILNNWKPNLNEWELIPREIALNQLKQEVGNCYMVSALEAISHILYLLTYIFGFTNENNFTSYQE